MNSRISITSSLLSVLLLLHAFLSLKLGISSDFSKDRKSTVEGLTHHEVMKLGEAIYRRGVLPSDQVMMATVRDIPIEGTMFTCQNCHMRSGLGTLEGKVITTPTNGRILFNPLPAGPINPPADRKNIDPRLQKADRRPAYTDETLAIAIESGIDSNGRKLHLAMPRYRLTEREMSILVYYLKNLSSEYSPGVTETTLRFATIIANGVSEEDRESMIAPLEAYIGVKNTDARHLQDRAKSKYAREMELSYRELLLDRWELKGAPESWHSQLESMYKSEPVFAILGGIAPGDWSPIHRFCEEKEIPCILPVTDFPMISQTDWYTLYFSKGFYKEGEAAARYLARNPEVPADIPIVQVFRNNKEGTALAKAFRETMTMFGRNPGMERMLSDDDVITDTYWKELALKYNNAAVILWLNGTDLSGIQTIVEAPQRPRMIFVSGGLLKERFDTIPDHIKYLTFITYPWSVPDEVQQRQKAFETWMKVRKITITNYRISSQMYFLGAMMSNALMHMKRHFYRDYFLDVIDMMADQTQGVISYPRVSFGQGQRYLSKGCYIVQLSQGSQTQIVKKSDWVIP